MSDAMKDAKDTLYPELVKILMGDVDQFHEALAKMPQHMEETVNQTKAELVSSLKSVQEAISQLPLDLDAGIEAKKRELADEVDLLAKQFEQGKGELQGIKDSALASISQAILSLSKQAAQLNNNTAEKLTEHTSSALDKFNEAIDQLVSTLNKSLVHSQKEALTEFKQTAIKSLAEMNSAYSNEYNKIRDLQEKTESTLSKFEKVIDSAFNASGKKLKASMITMIGINIVVTLCGFGLFYAIIK